MDKVVGRARLKRVDAVAPTPAAAPSIDLGSLVNSMPSPVLAVDANEAIVFVNPATEQFFETGASLLRGMNMAELMPPDSPLLTLIRQARESGSSLAESNISISSPRIGTHVVGAEVAPLAEQPNCVTVILHQRSIASRLDRQLSHRGAARSVTAMAAMLAHEVKNPLSGIRGAAQLLELNAGPDDRQLTRLICDETDRICALVDRMEVFSDSRPLERGPVNIHQVLEHVRRVAQNGFARNIRFVERYDPSLPPVFGHRDQLVQVFLNLVKNAAEAVEEGGGEIVLTTRFQHGVRVAMPGGDTMMDVPLEVSVQDNGPGIAEDLRPHLFDAFVTTKRNGTGLGLALVAKIVGDHGGVIDVESQPRRTVFRVLLPMVRPNQDDGLTENG
ncbi:MAG: PAS domain-containing protein [Rhodospirillales bacterium]|nr:PAS domain-containing protein [Rhodospirillales bacterium]